MSNHNKKFVITWRKILVVLCILLAISFLRDAWTAWRWFGRPDVAAVLIIAAAALIGIGLYQIVRERRAQKQTEQEEWAEQRRKAERRRRELLHQEALERQLFRARQERQADGREEPKGEDGRERSANEQ